jgi:hypothetical protein
MGGQAHGRFDIGAVPWRTSLELLTM